MNRVLEPPRFVIEKLDGIHTIMRNRRVPQKKQRVQIFKRLRKRLYDRARRKVGRDRSPPDRVSVFKLGADEDGRAPDEKRRRLTEQVLLNVRAHKDYSLGARDFH